MAADFPSMNIDSETGVRYGVINQDLVNYEMLWLFDTELSPCPNCGSPDYITVKSHDDLNLCAHCKVEYMPKQSWIYDRDGYLISVDEYGYLWVFRSPWKAKCGFCPPSYPGAIDLSSNNKDDYGYALGPEWFTLDRKIPYEFEPVWKENEILT